ncbi:MAG: hypothetical protein Q4G03_00880 [Planctomycetia bacterium]|nr:hypothetical protein [Planctomycetia bacterium]
MPRVSSSRSLVRGVICLLLSFASAVVLQNTVAHAQNLGETPRLTPVNKYDFGTNVRLFENVDLRPTVTSMAESEDRSRLYVGGDDHYVYAWNLETETVERLFTRKSDWIRAIALIPSNAPDAGGDPRIVTLAQNGQMEVWNLKTQQKLHETRVPLTGAHGLAYSSAGNFLVVSGFEPSILFYEPNLKQYNHKLPAPTENCTCLTVSSKGSYVAAAGRNGALSVWKANVGATLNTQLTSEQSFVSRRIRAIAFSEDETLVAAAGDSNQILVWNIENRQLVARLTLPEGKVFSLIFCGNDTLVSGDSVNKVRVWDLGTQTIKAQSLGQDDLEDSTAKHTGTVATLLYDPTEKVIYSGSYDTTIIKWKLP